MLQQLQAVKSEVSEVIRQVGELALSSGNEALRHNLVEERLPRLEEERFNLVVLGEFNHGKTTFVNALLGKPVLPVGVTPTTAAIHHIVWAGSPRAAVVKVGGERRELSLDDLRRYAVEGQAEPEGDAVRYIEVGYPAEMLRNNVTLVDTPGVNDLNLQRAEITFSYVPRSDAVLFLLDAGQVLKESERIFLEERLLKRSRNKIIFVVNKADLLTEPERKEALDYVRQHLAPIVPDPVVFGVSSTMALLGEGERSGLPALERHLSEFLGNERGRILVDNAIGDTLRAALSLDRHLQIRRRSLDMTEADLERRIVLVREELERRGRRIEELDSRIVDTTALLKSEVRKDLAAFGEALRASLVDDIKKASSDDVKKYLAGYVQDCFKRWAEQEGETVVARLERLAEETIALVNEDVKGTASRLAEKVGIDPKTLDLHVDTLYYDVGVFALGAFGMSVMFLSNVLVGGLLTLAAPLLAVVVREKVARDVRKRALENAPHAVSQAEAAVGQRFEQMIDDFGEKLSSFIAAAGEELHRGILDVLKRAREERREAGYAREMVESRIDAQQDRLGEVRAKLEQLRARVWQSPEADSSAS
jgi:small GTP-binding protein